MSYRCFLSRIEWLIKQGCWTGRGIFYLISESLTVFKQCSWILCKNKFNLQLACFHPLVLAGLPFWSNFALTEILTWDHQIMKQASLSLHLLAPLWWQKLAFRQGIIKSVTDNYVTINNKMQYLIANSFFLFCQMNAQMPYINQLKKCERITSNVHYYGKL